MTRGTFVGVAVVIGAYIFGMAIGELARQIAELWARVKKLEERK